MQFHKGRRQLVLGLLLSFMMMKMVLMIMLQSGTEEPSLLTGNKQGHTVSFDGYGPEHNETIKSLRKAIERGEVKLL